jgi:hypothetical protein
MEQATRFVGMDVHKNTIVVAVTATGEVGGKATAYGTFPNTAAALETLVKRLRQAGDGPIKFCYEAGPCGYGVPEGLFGDSNELINLAVKMELQAICLLIMKLSLNTLGDAMPVAYPLIWQMAGKSALKFPAT